MSDLRIGVLNLEWAQPGASGIEFSRFYIQSQSQIKGPGYTKRPPVMIWQDYHPLDMNMEGTEHWARARDTRERLERDDPDGEYRIIKRTAVIETHVIDAE